jgi:hypothetical protein
MANTQKPEVTKAQVEQATSLWHNFTHWSKISIIAIIICLALMALLLL